MVHSWRMGFVLCCAAAASGGLQAQTIQQPVLRGFSAATTVSAPDRGRTFIGGVSRGGEGGKSYGPFPSGTSTGRFHEGSSVSVTPFIHDFEAMDAAALDAADAVPHRPLGHGAEHARRVLLANGRAPLSRSADAVSRGPITPGVESARALRLGNAAAARGDLTLARLHWQLAARRGSLEAREMLSVRSNE